MQREEVGMWMDLRPVDSSLRGDLRGVKRFGDDFRITALTRGVGVVVSPSLLADLFCLKRC